MSEEKNSNRKAGGNADIPVDVSEFMPPMSFTGSRADMTKLMQADSQTDNQAEMPEAAEPAEEKPTKRKRVQTTDYKSLFLVRNELRDRQGLYISRENYGILQTLVRAIRNERLSVSGLVDNIISRYRKSCQSVTNQKYKAMKTENQLFSLDTLTGNWESANLNPTVIIYKNGNTYLLSIIYINETSKQASPATYEIQRNSMTNPNLFY